MGSRQVRILESAKVSIAKAAWFIEAKGMVATADKFADSIYDFIERLSNQNISYKICREPNRALLGLKCIEFKKYTIVYRESAKEITVVDFIPSKLISW